MTTLRRFIKLIKTRPGHLFATARGYLLFYLAKLTRTAFPLPGVSLGSNVRLQRNRSAMAEAPEASIHIDHDTIVYEDSKLEAYGKGAIEIGKSSILGGARIVCRYNIEIGARFLCSWNVFIQDYDSHPTDPLARRAQVEDMVHRFRPSFSSKKIALPAYTWDFPGEPIFIGDDVWIGAGATILKGAQIGSGSIVATGAIVLKGVYPPNSLIAGNPAVVVKSLNPEMRPKFAVV